MAQTNMSAFMAHLEARHGARLTGYEALHRWSVEHREAFWDEIWTYCGVIGEKGGRILVDADKMPGAKF
ncbi:MAG TPA: acetoacetate--CoA ligase, partial [Parvibaculum sp.]